MTWKITLANGEAFTCPQGRLEHTLREMRGRYGTDEFAVEALSEDAGDYVPELADREVPDTVPEDWT